MKFSRANSLRSLGDGGVNIRFCLLVLMGMLTCVGCGHTRVSKIGLLSTGNMEGRHIPADVNGPSLKGADYEMVSLPPFCFSFLSKALEDALEGTEYDTLVDVTVTSRTGLFVWSNGMEIEGTALKSANLPTGVPQQ